MKLSPHGQYSSSVRHECGELIDFYINIVTPVSFPPEIHMNEGRLTILASFAEASLYFKAHGTRTKHCPECKKPLPKTVEELSAAIAHD